MDVRELIGRRVRLAGHFPGVVVLEDVEPKIDGAVQLRVRLQSGGLEETLLTAEDLDGDVVEPVGEAKQLVRGDELFDAIEARRIELALPHEPNHVEPTAPRRPHRPIEPTHFRIHSDRARRAPGIDLKELHS